MPARRLGWIAASMVGAWLVSQPAPARAQTFEVAPFGGYRFGGDFFELVTGRAVDLDGAAAVGVAVNVTMYGGLQFEGLYSHERATFGVAPGLIGPPPSRVRVTVDHWLAGGLQEFKGDRARPFVTGLLGVTRYAGAGDSEVRFAISAGGGVKLFPTRSVGVRVEGRVFTTIVDADAGAGICGPGRCVLGLHIDAIWQVEMTTALVLRF
jgi:hypothetical protein